MVSLARMILIATSPTPPSVFRSRAHKTVLKTPLPCVANTSYLPSITSPTCRIRSRIRSLFCLRAPQQLQNQKQLCLSVTSNCRIMRNFCLSVASSSKSRNMFCSSENSDKRCERSWCCVNAHGASILLGTASVPDLFATKLNILHLTIMLVYLCHLRLAACMNTAPICSQVLCTRCCKQEQPNTKMQHKQLPGSCSSLRHHRSCPAAPF